MRRGKMVYTGALFALTYFLSFLFLAILSCRTDMIFLYPMNIHCSPLYEFVFFLLQTTGITFLRRSSYWFNGHFFFAVLFPLVFQQLLRLSFFFFIIDLRHHSFIFSLDFLMFSFRFDEECEDDYDVLPFQVT